MGDNEREIDFSSENMLAGAIVEGLKRDDNWSWVIALVVVAMIFGGKPKRGDDETSSDTKI